MKPLNRITAGLLVLLASACTVPGVGYVGGGPLPLDALAVTRKDPETGAVTQRVALEWPQAPNARTYEVIRSFNGAARTIATAQTDAFADTTVNVDQAFSYRVRALDGQGKELTVTNPVEVGVLKQEVGKPTGLEPAHQASVSVGESPTFSWAQVPGAGAYHLAVTRVSDGAPVWSVITANTSAKFGDASPLEFEKFATEFPVGTQSSIQAGLVYRWVVTALRLDAGADLNKARAVDANPSAVQTFSQGG